MYLPVTVTPTVTPWFYISGLVLDNPYARIQVDFYEGETLRFTTVSWLTPEERTGDSWIGASDYFTDFGDVVNWENLSVRLTLLDSSTTVRVAVFYLYLPVFGEYIFVTGTKTNEDSAWDLYGFGDLEVEREFAAIPFAGSSVVGTLSQSVLRSSFGSTSVSAALDVTRPLAGSSAGSSTVGVEPLVVDQELTASSAGVATAAASIDSVVVLAGSISGESTVEVSATGGSFLTNELASDGRVYYYGVAGNYASAPHIAAYDLTGDLDIRMLVTNDNWGSTTREPLLWHYGTQGYILDKYNGTQFLFGLTSTAYQFSTDHGITGSARMWIRVKRVNSTGAVTFYKRAPSETSWTTISGTTILPGTAIPATTSPLEIMPSYAGISWQGSVHQVWVDDGVPGPAPFDADFNLTPAEIAAGEFIEDSPYAATVTLNGADWQFRAVSGTTSIAAGISQVHELSGTVTGQAGVAPFLLEIEEAKGLTDGTSTVQGTVSIAETFGIVGSSAGMSTMAGTLSVTHTVSGVVTGETTITGSLTAVGATLNLVGTVDGYGTVTADLTAAIDTNELIGISTGLSTVGSGAEAGFVSEPWMTLLYRDMPREVSPGLLTPYSTMKVSRSTSPSPIGRCGNISVQSVVRPPRSSTAWTPSATCYEERLTGTNILTDPSFENHVSATGLTEIPIWDYNYPTVGTGSKVSDSGLVSRNGTPLAYRASGWASDNSGGNLTYGWEVATDDPRSGTYYAKHTNSGNPAYSPQYMHHLWPVGVYLCDPSGANDRHVAMTAVISPGDTMDFSIWAKGDGSRNSTFKIGFQYYDWYPTGPYYEDYISEDNSIFWETGSSWTQYSHESTAPAGAYVARVLMTFYYFEFAAGSGEISLDDAILNIE
jgi:hypothetical protein